MFQTICIKPNDTTFPTDIGYIAEKLLYYQNVRFIASPDSFPILLTSLGIDNLIELLKNRNFQIFVRQNLLGVATHSINGVDVHDVTSVSSASLNVEETIFRGIYKSTNRRGFSKRISQRLAPYVETISYENNISDLAREDLGNQSYVKNAILASIKCYDPHFGMRPEEIQYEFRQMHGGYLFETNLNYDEINSHIPDNPDGQLINPTGLMLSLLETRGDMHLASNLNAEMATSAMNTEIMKHKFHDIYQRTTTNSSNLFQFNDFALANGHAIREIVNSGEKVFSDFYAILDKAEKFREWLKSVDENANIIREYHDAVTKQTWVDKLPAKGFRWSFFTGAGLALDAIGTGGIGTAIGIAVSAGDAFLLDKLVQGWKPSIFIDDDLRPFVQNNCS